MKLVLLAALVLGASVLVLQAASAAKVVRAGAGPEMSRVELNLSADQIAKIEAIRKEAREQRLAIDKEALTREARRDKIVELQRSTHEKVMGVLTPEQRAKWDAKMAERRSHRFDKLSEFLGLSPEQQAQVKAITANERASLNAVRNDKRLSKAEKRAQVKAIRSDARDKFLQVLTPEQKAKLQSGQHHGRHIEGHPRARVR
ncbi:MAG: Spy/CpxP family protein refolding chaperone [Armatimonadota bacterium]